MSQSKVAQKIRRIAYKARRRAEEIAKREEFPDDLYGFCARGSAILWNELNKAGLCSQIVYNPGHVFVYCSGYYVDITATQFGLYKTMVRLEKSVERLNVKEYARQGQRLFPDWSIKCAWETFESPQSLQAWQYYQNWVHVPGVVKMDDMIPSTSNIYIKNRPNFCER